MALSQESTWETIWGFAFEWEESEANWNLSVSDLEAVSKEGCHLPVRVNQLYLLEELLIQSSPDWVCGTPGTRNQSLATLVGFPPPFRNIAQRWRGLFGCPAQVKEYFGTSEADERTAPDRLLNGGWFNHYRKYSYEVFWYWVFLCYKLKYWCGISGEEQQAFLSYQVRRRLWC